ncbi:MAG: response regulator transcription factor [Acidobacteria bacterium]|nr:response regulator transcription factor [Acidobacteriota bacterium]
MATSKKKTRILIADSEGIFRLGLRKLFGVEDDMQVVAQAESSGQITGLAEKFKPDLLFLQAEMLGGDPAEFIARIRHVWAGGKVIIVTPPSQSADGERWVKAGAAGVLARSADPEIYIKSARKVLHNELWVPKSQSAPAAGHSKEEPPRPADTLTRREKSIIACLVQGWRNREIAQTLSISEQTVKNHLRAIYDKVGVSDRLELALYAIHQKLELPPPPTAAASA